MKKYAIIGDHREKNALQKLYETGSVEMEIDAEYELVSITPEEFKNWIQGEFREQYDGAALFSPYNQIVQEGIDFETEASQKSGIINTLFWKEDGLCGTNTQPIGVLCALQTKINPAHKNILVLGADTASFPVLLALKTANAHLFLWDEKPEKSALIANQFQVETLQDFEFSPEEFQVIINTTGIGYQKWESVIPDYFWEPGYIALDLVTDPLETRFLCEAEDMGAQVIHGDRVLVYQALEQFKLWHGIALEPEIMAAAFFEEDRF